MRKRAVHFGAGSIGRGFIGQLLHDSGYSITFVDVDDGVIDQINETRSYTLRQIEHGFRPIVIDDVSAISATREEARVIRAIAEADIITTSVLAGNLARVAPVLLAGLRERDARGRPRVNVLACENAVGNSEMLRDCVRALDGDLAERIDDVAAFANTEVDRMVLASERDGRQTIDIGDEFELAIDATQLDAARPRPIARAVYTDHLSRYIERKLYIINGGHAWAGYIGHLHRCSTMQDVFGDEDLTRDVRATMVQIGRLICAKHGFSDDAISAYIEFALARFQTPGITDAVDRVCRSPIRKLGPGERLVAPAVECAARGLPNGLIAQGIAAALLFDAPADQESLELGACVRDHGIAAALEHVTRLRPGGELARAVLDHRRRFASGDLSVRFGLGCLRDEAARASAGTSTREGISS